MLLSIIKWESGKIFPCFSTNSPSLLSLLHEISKDECVWVPGNSEERLQSSFLHFHTHTHTARRKLSRRWNLWSFIFWWGSFSSGRVWKQKQRGFFFMPVCRWSLFLSLQCASMGFNVPKLSLDYGRYYLMTLLFYESEGCSLSPQTHVC